METCNRFIKRLMLLLAGWGAGGVFAFSQSLPAPVPEETVYFPLKDIRLLDSPFLDLQQKGKEYLLWLNPDSLLHFIGLKRDCRQKLGRMPAGSRKMCGERDLSEEDSWAFISRRHR